MKIYKKIAGLLQAMENCMKSENHEWYNKHEAQIEQIIKNDLPSGSGFDGTTTLSEKSTGDKLIFRTEYHCMDEHGYYDEWVNLSMIVTPSLQHGMHLRVNWHGYGGEYKNLLYDYIHDLWFDALEGETQL